jgi:sialate O-acetylesterase
MWRSGHVLLVLIVVGTCSTNAAADVRVPSLIGDHMVVQRGKPVRLWGQADPGETVRASLAGADATTEADASGRWALTLPALAAGGPHTLTIRGRNVLTFRDVQAGEVFVASGQSNMEWPLSQSLGAGDALKAGCGGLRLFTVTKATAVAPRDDVQGMWLPCNEETAPSFSAVAFHFGQALHRALGLPIGLVHTSWGGTPAEAWTPREALLAESSLAPMVHELDTLLRDPSAREEAARKLAEWEARNFHQDTRNTGEAQGFARGGDDAGWLPMELPQYWENAGLRMDGAVWFRRTADVPAAWAGRDATLSLGAIDDFDTTYWNGERVGTTGRETPQFYAAPRQYTVPGRLVKAGRNVVAVRVFDHFGNGGFGGTAPEMTLRPIDGQARLSLAGTWRYRIERRLDPAMADFSTQPRLPGADDPNSPTVLWNAMTAALTPFPVAGVIWYQGESNAGRAFQYRTLFPAMIESWRRAWREPELPFLFVQLANFTALARTPGDSEWAELREAQTMTLRLPKTGMAVTLDIGDADDIHPRNKKEVGHRLALQALRLIYGQSVVASGPRFVSAMREEAAMRVRFETGGTGLMTTDGSAPVGFAVAGADRRWRWAEARIEGDTVLVSSPEVSEPVAVRYGWADNPPNTLRSRAGLPAEPFRTDTWPGMTEPSTAPASASKSAP